MKHLILLLACIWLITSCKIADLSQSTQMPASTSEEIARKKLNAVVDAQGFRVLQQKNLYTMQIEDHWRGMLGRMVRLWPDPKTQFKFHLNYNTFDGNARFLSGKRKGDLIGVQAWQYYEQTQEQATPSNEDTGAEHNPLEFGLVVLHYFTELPLRLSHAPIQRFYGQRQLNGITYDLVFVSWGSETANADHDQYIVWINPETNLIDYCVYTLRTNKNPLTRNKYGSIAFLDYQENAGFKYPLKMPVFLDDGAVKVKDLNQYFHQFSVQQFQFGGFEENTLYPLPNLPKKIDSK